MSFNVPVLIVGAGPAGLVAALSLAQHGIKVRIIDKSRQVSRWFARIWPQ
ncbi:hypothetical protein EW146_g9018, partial [Bondarzewia mesenterica]